MLPLFCPRPPKVNIPDNVNATGNPVNIEVVVEKRRPPIHVYDLPPEYNSLLLEGWHFKLECVNRIYDPNNATIWRDMLYGAQVCIGQFLMPFNSNCLVISLKIDKDIVIASVSLCCCLLQSIVLGSLETNVPLCVCS